MGKPLEHRGALTLMALAVVVAIVAAYAAVPSGASQYNVTPGQIAALNAKVNKLQKQVRALNKTVNALGTIVVNCVTYKALGVARNGVPPSEGYVYQNAAGSQFATALDLAPASSAPCSCSLHRRSVRRSSEPKLQSMRLGRAAAAHPSSAADDRIRCSQAVGCGLRSRRSRRVRRAVRRQKGAVSSAPFW
jgi:hypothetical protein